MAIFHLAKYNLKNIYFKLKTVLLKYYTYWNVLYVNKMYDTHFPAYRLI